MSRWTPSAYRETTITPIEKSAGKTSPIAASSLTSRVLVTTSTSATVTTPVSVAATRSSGDVVDPTTRNPSAIPTSTECPIASETSDCRRSTRNVPTRAQATAVTTAIAWISSWPCVIAVALPRVRAR